MYYHFKVTKEKTGFSAVCIELSGCVTQAESKSELERNMHEALNLYLDEPSDSRAIYPLPRIRVSARNIVEVPVNPRIAFAFALRRQRLSLNLTQREAANQMGIQGSLHKYQRLESSDTANPELETLVQIMRAFPDFPIKQVAS